MAKNLEILLRGVQITKVVGNTDIYIDEIFFDTRSVGKHDVFVAITGTQFDGHTFIPQAIENGSKVIVCEILPETFISDVVYIQTENTSKALGILASNYYGNPSKKLNLVGVTGTNGKTTTATLLYELFENMGHKCGLFSTINNFIHKKEISATHTTPNALKMNELLSHMVDEGCEYCFMEVSSHSVVQERIAGLTFAGGIFSNLTHDHLDYHGTFAEYLKAKKRFFDNLPDEAFALTNIDDKNGEIMLQNCIATKKSYALKTFADFNCKIYEIHFDGTLLSIDNNELWVHFVGNFNAYNFLAVYSAAKLLGKKTTEILTVLSSLKPVNGRFNTININEVTAIVDYAHTPDALQNVLKAIAEIKQSTQNVITVVGAGGDRDKTKRPLMAKIAVNYSSKVILTSDNPRSEKPEDIINEMYKGVQNTEFAKVVKITDRKEAIRTACLLANKGDIILIAGKGHETYQEINGVRNHFDDKEVVTEMLGYRS